MFLFITVLSLLVGLVLVGLTSSSIFLMVLLVIVSVFMSFVTTIMWINKPREQRVTWRG